jgi:deoxyinosine 3'endonuclease (endonuclease V)
LSSPVIFLHGGSLAHGEAAAVQTELRAGLILSWDGRAVESIGGVDVALEEDVARAAIVIIRLSDLKPIEGVTLDRYTAWR